MNSQSVHSLAEFLLLLEQKDAVGIEAENFFHVKVKIAANAGFCLCLGWVVGKARYAHQAILETEIVDDFNHTGGEGDDALAALV